MGTTFELRFVLTFGLPLWIIIRGLILVNRKKNGIKINLFGELLINLFVIYLFILIGITIFPIYIGEPMPHLAEMSMLERCNINIILFTDYFKGGISINSIIRNLGGNLLLLFPFILYLCARFIKIRNLKSCMLTSFFMSLSIELIQLIMNVFFLADRIAVHVEDLILNTIGGVLAFYIFNLIYKGEFKNMVDSINPKAIEDEV